MIIERRSLLAAAALTPLLALPGCAGGQGFSLVEAIRRLLTLSSQRAFAALMEENGFFDSQIARISVPDRLGGSTTGGVVAALLRTDAFRSRLSRQVNRAAEKGAALAAPIVTDAISTLTVDDARAVVRGPSNSAATSKLYDAVSGRLVEAMLPGISDGLKLFDSAVVTQALKLATGIDFAGLRDDVTRQVSDAIFAAIASEEAAIRANPNATGDPLLMAVFGLAR